MITRLRYYKKTSLSETHSSLRKLSSGAANFLFFAGIVLISILFTHCESFFDPDQDLVRKDDQMFANWDEYRSAAMGLYSLQQQLVDQIVILGELRADLLKITENATPDLIDVYNFNIRKDNPYASPVNFYKLIFACNKLIQKLNAVYPEVLDKDKPITNYDRLYGEALCMRAWAYFNAVRIYGKVPYIHESLNSIEEIQNYVNSRNEFIVSEYIRFAPNGYNNDTIRDTTIVLEKLFLNQKAVIDTFTNQLTNNVKAVGVNHSLDNNDITWQVTVWNDYARNVLLGQMYLFDQNYTEAIKHFNPILYNYTSETSNIKFGLDRKFEKANWRNIFTGIDSDEHIFTLWFNKSYKQTHNLQRMFSSVSPNNYMIKPSNSCILKWEAIWDNPVYNLNYNSPANSEVINPGIPGDFYRGYGVSYKYFRKGEELSADAIQEMLIKKQVGNFIDVQLLMQDVDTVVTKYDIGRNEYAQDANFIIYRAAGVHLYAAEIYAIWSHVFGGSSIPRTNLNRSLNILNDGSYDNNPLKLGVRGRVGFADNAYERVQIQNIIFIHDPITNIIVTYYNYTNNPDAQRNYLIDRILEERARELACEGERFYDLMRVARRRNDPSFLADKVAAKFDGDKKEIIRNLLMNEQNWYIDYFQ